MKGVLFAILLIIDISINRGLAFIFDPLRSMVTQLGFNVSGNFHIYARVFQILVMVLVYFYAFPKLPPRGRWFVFGIPVLSFVLINVSALDGVSAQHREELSAILWSPTRFAVAMIAVVAGVGGSLVVNCLANRRS